LDVSVYAVIAALDAFGFESPVLLAHWAGPDSGTSYR
jgi:hypothetical protein